jgi:hypothetical protein
MMVSHQPRYFFDLEGPDETDTCIDEFGTPQPSDDAAMEYAKRVIRELIGSGGYDDPAWQMVVKDEKRDIVFVIPFRNALSAKVIAGVASIIPFIRPRSDFGDDITRIMGEAFEAACSQLRESQPAAVQEFIAKQIIAAARLGERDVERLRDVALAAFGLRPPAPE